jgi:membrane protein implicated in regulation of membrane protease activity
MPLSPIAIWSIIGFTLILVELFLPTAFIAFVMGISALMVAALSTVLSFNLQIALWGVLSIALVMVSRRFVSRRAALKLDATEAQTLTEILPGETGRVLYEGNSWNARSEAEMTIAPNQRVYVVGRKGTTLLVMPDLIH